MEFAKLLNCVTYAGALRIKEIPPTIKPSINEADARFETVAYCGVLCFSVTGAAGIVADCCGGAVVGVFGTGIFPMTGLTFWVFAKL